MHVKSVVKMADGMFKLNDDIIISDIECDDDGISYKMNFDESTLTQGECEEIVRDFFFEALNDAVNEETN